MIPNILEYDSGRVTITPEAFMIPELNAIIKKYKKNPEPYLAYVCGMSHPASPYINVPSEVKKETVIFDVKQTLGDFDFTDPLLEKAIDRQKSLYTSKLTRWADELGEELDRFTSLLRDTPLTFDNAQMRQDILKNASKYASEYEKTRKQADEEIKSIAVKGDHEIGMY